MSRVAWGYEGIGREIGRTPQEVKWLVQQGRLRIRRHGHRTISALVEHLLEDCGGIPEEKEAANEPS
jgi:hypothetical protein